MTGTHGSWLARALAFVLLLPVTAAAQQASGIAGVARDTSGSVLPGVTPSLGRNLAGNARTAPVAANLVGLATMFEGRITRLDVRVSKRMSISRRLRADGYVDMYNIMNGSAILTGRP